ncbi:MAG TPA: cation diffusion facilitator family transporter [Burkholderiaceae bacterium]|nr:cation diffusion facilitator family transporter [Burkholderiaceae bacterium]
MHDHHAHHHAAVDLRTASRRALLIGIALNAGFVVVEATAGWITGSLALLSDAAHNLSDVGGLALTYATAWAATLAGSARRTYGWRRLTILGALGNAVLILAAMGAIGWEAVRRLSEPAPISGGVVIAVAATGVLVNGLTATLLARGSKRDLNVHGAFLHMVSDAVVSLGVVVSGGIYLATGWLWVDPATSLAIAVVIVVSTWSLLRQSVHLTLDGVPAAIELDAVRATLLELDGVTGLHDLHVWAMSTTETALTAHLVVPGLRGVGDELNVDAARRLRERFGIEHVTIQLETDPSVCASGAHCEPTTAHRHD